MKKIAYVEKNKKDNSISVYLGEENFKEKEFTTKFYDKASCVDLFNLIYELQFIFNYTIKFKNI